MIAYNYNIYQIILSVIFWFLFYSFVLFITIISVFGDLSFLKTQRVSKTNISENEILIQTIRQLKQEVYNQKKNLELTQAKILYSTVKPDFCSVCIGHTTLENNKDQRIPIVCDYGECVLSPNSIPELWNPKSVVYLIKIKQLSELIQFDLDILCYSKLLNNPSMDCNVDGVNLPDTVEKVMEAYKSTDKKWDDLRELVDYLKENGKYILFNGKEIDL